MMQPAAHDGNNYYYYYYYDDDHHHNPCYHLVESAMEGSFGPNVFVNQPARLPEGLIEGNKLTSVGI